MVTTSNGSASGFGYKGCNGAFVGRVLIFIRWHSAHPFTYMRISIFMRGHQYDRSISSVVLLIPGCPYTDRSWWFRISCLFMVSPPVTTRFPFLYQVP